MLTHEELLRVLSYDPESGVMTWRVRPAQKIQVGDVAGTPTTNGYTLISYARKIYKAHRLAWFYVHGEWPDGLIDHVNGVTSDNRIVNLRLATKSENSANSKKRKTSSAKYKGISLHKHSGLWHARITKHGITTSLGYYRTQETAHAAYVAAAKIVFGEFVHDGSLKQAGCSPCL